MPRAKLKRDNVTGKFMPRSHASDRGERGVKLKGCIVVWVVIHKAGVSYVHWEDVEAFIKVKDADDYVNNDTTGRRLDVQRRILMKINGYYHRVNAYPMRIPIRGLEEQKDKDGTDTNRPGAEAQQGDVQSNGGGAGPGEDGRQPSEEATGKLPALLRSPVVPGPTDSNVKDPVNASGDEVLRDSGKRRTRRRTDVARGTGP